MAAAFDNRIRESSAMATIHYPPSHPSAPRPTEDRRSRDMDPALTPKRRINDTFFNKARWPVFMGLWFVGGLAVIVYLLLAFMKG